VWHGGGWVPPVDLRCLQWADPEEATVANKDKGSNKTDKKKAQHNLKEKRAAKKTKRAASSSSSSMSTS
jgi:hypothetical protein